MDLAAYKVWITREKGVHQLVEQVEEIVKSQSRSHEQLSRIADTLADGLWLRNPASSAFNFQLEPEKWVAWTLSHLQELRILWTKIYDAHHENPSEDFLILLKNRSSAIGDSILTLVAGASPNATVKLKKHLVQLVTKLSELNNIEYHIFWGTSGGVFETYRTEIVGVIEAAIKQANTINRSSNVYDEQSSLKGSPVLPDTES